MTSEFRLRRSASDATLEPMHRALRFGSLALFILGGCVVRTGPAAQQPQAQQPIPPPPPVPQPAFAYYNGNAAPPPTRVPAMPPALSVPDFVNMQHLRMAAAQPRRCDHPIEVSPGNFIHLDCVPYRRIQSAAAHLTPAKLLAIRRPDDAHHQFADEAGVERLVVRRRRPRAAAATRLA